MKRKRTAKIVKAVGPSDSWQDSGPVRWQENAPYFTEDPTGLEQLWPIESLEGTESETPVMYGWFSVDNLYFGDMELSMMPVQMKVRAARSVAPRKIERFSLFYQADNCFRYALPGERGERA